MSSIIGGGPDNLIDTIYEAAVLPELWRDVLDRMAKVTGSVGGYFLALSPGSDIRSICSDAMTEAVNVFFREGWGPRNSRATRLAKMRYPGFATDSDLFTPEELRSDPLHTDFLARFGLGWGAGTIIPIPSGDLLAIAVDGAEPVAHAAVGQLDALRPHLARAALLSARLRLERVRTATEVLGQIGLPAAVVYANGRLAGANALFEQLGGQIRFRAQDRFDLVHPPSNDLLSEALSQLRSRNGTGAVLSIPMPATARQAPMVVHVVPVKGSANDFFTGALVFLIVTAIVIPETPSADLLDVLFDLTPSEARLAALIASGRAPRAAAELLGVTEQTARTTLKHVFTKVGVSRQSELAALLSRLVLR